ncbi:MAG: alpha/beta fold hydrolase [Nitrospirae bacterium]|nr:alpha/beta fold hydrolase [Nitrospirota bacterium]
MEARVTMMQGDRSRPAVLFIHGLGMDGRVWTCPEESQVLGGKFPLGILVSGKPGEQVLNRANEKRAKGYFFGESPGNLSTLFHCLGEQGYTVIAWSQKRPAAETAAAVSELKEILSKYEEQCRSGVILVGHSRGGLVGRAHLAGGDRKIRALVTLATPHRGSRMAQWAEHMRPLIALINPLLPDSEKGTAAYAAKRVLGFLSSRAVRELLPDSRFFASLHDAPRKGVHYLSFGGNDPTLFSIYRKVIERVQREGRELLIVKARKVFSFPDILEKIVPESLFPDEMKHGRGDGLVSVESARLPWADEHCDIGVNHAGILFDEGVNLKVTEMLNALR